MKDDGKIEKIRQDAAAKLNKWGNRVQVGYTAPPEPDRHEGDEWTDNNGKKWTVKNGIKQSISKLQDARRPWFCPKCSKSMSHRFDSKFYNLYNQCYDCTVVEHSRLMETGQWDKFEKKVMRNNEKSFLKDSIQEREDYIRTFKVPQAHFSNGGWEYLARLEHFTEMFGEIKQDIEFCKGRLKQIEEDELNDK